MSGRDIIENTNRVEEEDQEEIPELQRDFRRYRNLRYESNGPEVTATTIDHAD